MSSPLLSDYHGLDIRRTAHLLRNYQTVERRCVKILAGWFLAAPAYEVKYQLAYHLLDHADHVTWFRQRLGEMRGGQPDAAVAPALRELMDEALHAPSAESMLRGLYGVIKRELLRAYNAHLEQADPSANAVEIRILRRIVPEIEAQLRWYDGLGIDSEPDSWKDSLAARLATAGGIAGDKPPTSRPAPFDGPRFQRPTTIVFDARIAKGELTGYEVRQGLDELGSTVEQFKVFFNEMYAAAVLAAILFDSFEDGHPWEMYADFSRHFWDETRHSEFGSIRLQELGTQPSVCNPVLFERSQGLPVLHRIAYLTRGLEAYFMPRKQPRVREYEARGDHRSQLFADQDWSDEITHVRYGSTWCDHLLKDDFRTVEDLLEEVKQHLAAATGQEVGKISAPF